MATERFHSSTFLIFFVPFHPNAFETTIEARTIAKIQASIAKIQASIAKIQAGLWATIQMKEGKLYDDPQRDQAALLQSNRYILTILFDHVGKALFSPFGVETVENIPCLIIRNDKKNPDTIVDHLNGNFTNEEYPFIAKVFEKEQVLCVLHPNKWKSIHDVVDKMDVD